MLSQELIRELQNSWLPNMTDAGLNRIIELLEKNSPLLIHGCFSRSVPMGCLATHIAWNHPETTKLTVDAGINWMTRIAGLNPATSHVIREWDCRGPHHWEIRAALLEHFMQEKHQRSNKTLRTEAFQELVEV